VNVSENHALDIGGSHLDRIHFVQFFFFQGCEEALHTGVVIATAGAAHALDSFVPDQCRPEFVACKLTATIAVQDHFKSAIGICPELRGN